jgi:hypothetical protein
MLIFASTKILLRQERSKNANFRQVVGSIITSDFYFFLGRVLGRWDTLF